VVVLHVEASVAWTMLMPKPPSHTASLLATMHLRSVTGDEYRERPHIRLGYLRPEDFIQTKILVSHTLTGPIIRGHANTSKRLGYHIMALLRGNEILSGLLQKELSGFTPHAWAVACSAGGLLGYLDRYSAVACFLHQSFSFELHIRGRTLR
jgi:hypothetical protein